MFSVVCLSQDERGSIPMMQNGALHKRIGQQERPRIPPGPIPMHDALSIMGHEKGCEQLVFD